MRVKIGDKWHDSNDEPICIEFIDNDLDNINNMAEGATRYASAPDDCFSSSDEFLAWMG